MGNIRANWEIPHGHNAVILPVIYNCSNRVHENLGKAKTKQNAKQEYVIDWTPSRWHKASVRVWWVDEWHFSS